MKKNIFIDDLVCLYNCVDLELQRLQLSSMPDTLKDYFNQLTKLLSIIHSDILEMEKSDKQRE